MIILLDGYNDILCKKNIFKEDPSIEEIKNYIGLPNAKVSAKRYGCAVAHIGSDDFIKRDLKGKNVTEHHPNGQVRFQHISDFIIADYRKSAI
jgi:hypothetical protein